MADARTVSKPHANGSPLSTDSVGVPVYLDINALLDVLASLEGGFSLVEKVTSSASGAAGIQANAGTEFGVPNVLSLLKINVGGGGSRERSEQVEADRYHTYGSLLHRLRQTLRASDGVKLPKSAEAWNELRASDFVELRGTLNPNPLTASLQTVSKVLDLVQLVQTLDLTGAKSKEQRDADKASTRQMDQIKKLFDALSQDLEQDDAKTYVMEVTDPSRHRAVLSIFPEYLRDKSGTELRRGEFVLFGKVVRSLLGGEAINLIPPGSSLFGVTDQLTDPLIAALEKMSEGGFRLPRVVTQVDPPALQLLPIAVFV